MDIPKCTYCCWGDIELVHCVSPPSQPIQRASPSTSWWASVSASSWRCASWWPPSPAGPAAPAAPANLPLPPRGDSWRSPARKRTRTRRRALQRLMGRTQRALKWQWGPWVTAAASQTGLWGAWMCSRQPMSWRRLDVWKRGNESSGRSGGTGSRTSWSQGRGLLDECITTNRHFDWAFKVHLSDCKGQHAQYSG